MEYNGNVYFLVLMLIFLVVLTGFWLSPAADSASSLITATVAVGVCGNNIVEYGEQCDGSALDGQTCLSLGYDGGTLSCNPACGFNISECVNLEPEEEVGSIVFSGKAYPQSVVKILKDGQIAATTAGSNSGNFETTLSDITIGSYSFAIYAYDSNGNKSKTITYTREISKDEILEISGIIIPPTLSANKEEVEQGEKITFSGQSAPSAEITIYLDSSDYDESIETTAGSNGFYSYSFDTDDLELDDYEAKAKTTISGFSPSGYSKAIFFEVSENSEISEDDSKKADLNDDSRVNLIDFSILIHWFELNNFPNKVDLTEDEKVNLSDFSVMMYYWTG